MYPLISVLIIIIGIILLVYAKAAKKNNTPAACIKIGAFIMIAAGLLMLYFLISGILTLPLSGI